MDFTTYIMPELLLLIPVLWIIGYVVKQSKVADEKIPLILFIAGIFLAGLWIVVNAKSLTTPQEWGMVIFSAITQGILCAGTAIGCNQVVKQTQKAKSTSDAQTLAQNLLSTLTSVPSQGDTKEVETDPSTPDQTTEATPAPTEQPTTPVVTDPVTAPAASATPATVPPVDTTKSV